MARTITIGTLAAKTAIDAEPMLAGMRNLEKQTKQAQSAMSKEWEKFKRKMDRNWGAADIGKSILGGLGIGSGFALAQLAVEKMASSFKEAAEAAKSMEESTGRQLDLTRQLIAMNQTPSQQMGSLEKQRRDLQEELDRFKDEKSRTFTTRDMQGTYTHVAALSPAQQGRVDQLTEELQKKDLEIGALRKSIRTLDDKFWEGLEKEVIEDRKREKEGELNQLKERVRIAAFDHDTLASAIEKTREATDKLAEDQAKETKNLLDMADASRAYQRELDEVNLKEAAGVFTAEQALNIRKAIAEAFYKGRADSSGVSTMGEELRDITDNAKEANAEAVQLGLTFSSAFEDAIVTGGKLRDVLGGLAQDVLRILVRSTITTPMAAYLTTAFSAFGGPRAGGGPVSGGTPYLVGERGPELFVPSTSGTVVSNSQVGGEGPIMNFVYNIASGVTRAELKPLLDQNRAQLRAEIPNLVRRGGAYRSAFA